MSRYFVRSDDRKAMTLAPGVEAMIASGEQMTASVVDLAPGAEVVLHAHPHEQIGVVLAGRARFTIGDEEQVLESGDFYRIPGGVEHRAVALEGGARVIDCFHPVRDDYS